MHRCDNSPLSESNIPLLCHISLIQPISINSYSLSFRSPPPRRHTSASLCRTDDLTSSLPYRTTQQFFFNPLSLVVCIKPRASSSAMHKAFPAPCAFYRYHRESVPPPHPRAVSGTVNALGRTTIRALCRRVLTALFGHVFCLFVST